MNLIEENTATYLLYALWIVVYGLMNFAGSLGLYQALKHSARESQNPGRAAKTAFWLGMLYCLWIVLPFVVPLTDADFTGLIALSSGFLFCYGFLGLALGLEFPSKPKSIEIKAGD